MHNRQERLTNKLYNEYNCNKILKSATKLKMHNKQELIRLIKTKE